MKNIKWGDVFLWDCLEIMDSLIAVNPSRCTITDPPILKLFVKWDQIIPFDKERLNSIKPNGAIVLFGSEPLVVLRMSNIKMQAWLGMG